MHGIESPAFSAKLSGHIIFAWNWVWLSMEIILFYFFLFNYIFNSKLERVILNFDWRSLELHIIGFLINSTSRIQGFRSFFFFFFFVCLFVLGGFARQTTMVCHKISPSMTSLDPVLFVMGMKEDKPRR